MAAPLDQSSKEDDLKTQFLTREGTYRLMNLSEYSRPNRVGYTSNQSSPQVRVSIVSMPDEGPPPGGSSNAGGGGSGSGVSAEENSHNRNSQVTNGHGGGGDLQVNQISSTTPSSSTGLDHGGGGGVVPNGPGRLIAAAAGTTTTNNHHVYGGPCATAAAGGDRICFNFGKELFVYPYRGMKKAGPDLNKPIDKKLYKGTNPSCHDFNATTASQDSTMLLIGFTTGQIQLVQPGKREPGKLFNEDRLIDKTKVTCLKWLPNSANLFLAGHSSGHLYLYNEELPCAPTTAPNYQAHKLGDGFSVHTCKSKVARNPLQRWTFGTDNGSINEFAFSPCGHNLAIASQDGFLRVFRYESMELLGIARSYFGGFLCVCWSPDGKYIVVGGEDDLVTIWSLHERRVVARGQGHRSWVSVVAFDPYTTSYANLEDNDPDVSDDDGVSALYRNAVGPRSNDHINNNTINNRNAGGDEFYRNKMSNGGIPSNSRTAGGGGSVRRKSSVRPHSVSGGASTSYRLGSVSQDTQLCLWDITEDLLRQPVRPLRHSVHSPPLTGGEKGMRIEVKPSAATTTMAVNVLDSTNVTQSAGNNNNSNSSSNNNNNNNTTGQTPVSSLSSISSVNNNTSSDKVDGTVLARDHRVGVVKADSMEGGGGKVAAQASTMATVSGGSSGGGGSSNKQQKASSSGGTISLIGNCVGNNMHKMTMSSSISSTSSITSNQTVGGNGGGGGIEDGAVAGSSSSKAIGNGAKSSTDSSTNSSSGGGMATLNAFTQRLSHFSFGNEKKEGGGGGSAGHQQQHQGKKGFSLSKPFGGHNSISKSATSAQAGSSHGRSVESGHNHHHSAIAHIGGSSGEDRLALTTFDPIKLIGSTACPRFDECPVLEPLICKKIAHERLTALIFREDCFLTACQDGIIYTWARPPPFEQGNTKLPQT